MRPGDTKSGGLTLCDGFGGRVADLETLVLAEELVPLEAVGDSVGGELQLCLLEDVASALVPEFLHDVGGDEVVGRGLAEGRHGRGDEGAGVDDQVLDGALTCERRLLLGCRRHRLPFLLV